MFIRRQAALAAITAIALLALGAATASAATTLRTDPGGVLLSGSTTLRNTTSDPSVLATQAGTVTCNQVFLDADANTNSSATSITGKLTALTFTSCTDTILAINIMDCTLQPGTVPTVTITAGAGGGSVVINDPVVRCTTSTPGRACYLTAASVNGNAVNANSSIAFSNVAIVGATPAGVTDAIPPASCFVSPANLGFTLTHIVQSTNSTLTVTTS
jgi:hypothetical protein